MFSKDFFFIHSLYSNPAITIIVLSLSPLCVLWTASQQREILKPSKGNFAVTIRSLTGPSLYWPGWPWPTNCLRVSDSPFPRGKPRLHGAISDVDCAEGNVLEINLSGPKTEEEETLFTNMAYPLVEGWAWQCAVSLPGPPSCPSVRAHILVFWGKQDTAYVQASRSSVGVYIIQNPGWRGRKGVIFAIISTAWLLRDFCIWDSGL